MLVAGLIASATLLVAHATLSREAGAPYRLVLSLAFAAASGGVLAKGLIGAVLPVLVLLAWGFATRRIGKVSTLLLWAPGWLLFMLVAAPWFVDMQHRFPGFAHYFFVVQHFQRFASTDFNNPQPFWFYPAVLVLLALPWSGWLLTVLRRKTPPVAPSAATRMRADVRLLMLSWLVVVTVFFSLPSSKLVGYILPALAPLAYLVAEAVSALPRRWRVGNAGLAAACCVAIAVSAPHWQPKSREALALQLHESRQPSEPVIYLDSYDYDVAFYAHLDMPVTVVDPWSPHELAKDSWRRELVDAEGFAGIDAPRRLLRPDELNMALCRSAGTWIVGPWPAPPEPPWLATLPPAFRSGKTALWHVETGRQATIAALGCGTQFVRTASSTPTL
jgi:hypothetical protein